MKRVLRSVAIALVTLLPFALLVMYQSVDWLMSDSTIIETFEKKRSVFEKLRSMVREDDFSGRLALNYHDDDAISSERLDEYRALMHEAEVKVITSYGRDRGVAFAMDLDGMIFAGSSKSIVYYKSKPRAPIYASLDKPCRSSGEPSCSAARKLDGNWWIIRTDYK